MPVLPRLLPLALVAALIAGLVLSGCAGKDDEPSEPVAGESPSATPTTSAPTPTPTPSPSPTETPVTLADRLLEAADVPGLNESWTWVDDETVTADDDTISYCDKFDVYTLGAEEALHRTYGAPAGAEPALNRASELIARFPDEATANRAFQVLLSWHRGCAKRITPDVRAEVGPLASPEAPGARTFWYLVTVPEFDMDPGSFSAFGAAVVADRVVLLTMDSAGPDFIHPRGREPMVGMLRAAAARLR